MADLPRLPEQAADAVRGLGIDPRSAVAWVRDQRHESWRACGPVGGVWIKIERVASPIAGVEREADILTWLDTDSGRAPRLLARGRCESGRPFLVTAEITGTSISDAPGGPWTHDAACALRAFASRPPPRWLAEQRGNDLFGDAPDLSALLRDAADNGPLRELASRIGGRTTIQDVGLVHGSFDPDNVIACPYGRVAFVDFEATRVGPSSVDVAAMTAGLVLRDGHCAAARSWLSACATNLPDFHPVDVAGHILVRICHRRDAGELPQRDHDALVSVVSELAAGAPYRAGSRRSPARKLWT